MSRTIKEDNIQPDNLAFVDSMWKGTMFYHTNIRNVGLYTSVSLALLGYATRLKKKSSHTTALFFLLASFSFLILAILLNYHLYQTMNELIKDTPDHKEEFQPLLNISRYIFPIHGIIVFMIGGYIVFHIRNK
jgi:hypothetical protein